MKPNLSLWRSWRRNKLFDRRKDDGKFFAVFLLETFDLAREIGIAVHEASELHKRAHDRDIHLDRARARRVET